MTSEFSALEKEILSGAPVEIPSSLKSWLSRWKRLYINGHWTDGTSRETFRDFYPATGAELSEVCLARKEDVEESVLAARAAFEKGDWARRSVQERAQALRKVGDRILEHRAPLAILESLDTGKPIRETFDGDIPRAAMNFHFFSEFGLHEGTSAFENMRESHVTMREPLGVVALITPWNLPLYLETWKIAPSLLMGNSVVLKPSELTPLTATYLTELLDDLDLPPGVFNLLQGFGEKSTGAHLVSHPAIDAISFTGETSTGRAIMAAAAAGPTRVSFELGGKGAFIVFGDSDLEEALNVGLRAAFRNQGEICLATPRFFIEKSVYADFVKRFAAQAKEIRIGNPLSYKTEMGALISEEHWEKVMSYIARVESPMEILCGGSRPMNLPQGYYLSPTIIEGVPADHPIMTQEIFGPVISMTPFENESEVISLANNTPYGLSASLWTENLSRAQRMSRALRFGLVWVNSWFIRDLRVPFGGQKRSGVGREGGHHSLDFFSEWKSVCYRWGPS